mgnify:CR=1 FL=1
MQYSRPMSDIQTATAAAVKVRLTRLGITQEALALKVGMSPASLSARLTGRTPMNTRDLEMIAKGLDLADAFALIELARAEATPAVSAA